MGNTRKKKSNQIKRKLEIGNRKLELMIAAGSFHAGNNPSLIGP